MAQRQVGVLPVVERGRPDGLRGIVTRFDLLAARERILLEERLRERVLSLTSLPCIVGPTITDVADSVQIQHHSVVGLFDRAVDAGLCRRTVDNDARVTRLSLTTKARHRLRSLARVHYEPLARLGPQMQQLWTGLGRPV